MLKVQNIVSVSDFRQDLSGWLEKVKDDNSVVLISNSKPTAILVDPDYFAYLEKYADGYYDAGDVAEAKRALANREDEEALPFDVNNYS